MFSTFLALIWALRRWLVFILKVDRPIAETGGIIGIEAPPPNPFLAVSLAFFTLSRHKHLRSFMFRQLVGLAELQLSYNQSQLPLIVGYFILDRADRPLPVVGSLWSDNQ